MIEVWEYVMRKTEKWELVALDLLDCSAVFDSIIHIYILREMEVYMEYTKSYLNGLIQYTVVEAANSTPKKMKNGVPQGRGLSTYTVAKRHKQHPRGGPKDTT